MVVWQLIAGVPVIMFVGYLLRCRVSEFAAMAFVCHVGQVVRVSIRIQAMPARVAADFAWAMLMCLLCTAVLSALSRWRMRRNAQHEARHELRILRDVIKHHPGTIVAVAVSTVLMHSPLGQVLLEAKGNHDVVALFFATGITFVVATYGSVRVDHQFVGVPERVSYLDLDGGDETGRMGGGGGDGRGGGGSSSSSGGGGDPEGERIIRVAHSTLAARRRTNLAFRCLVASRLMLAGLILWGDGGDATNPRLVPPMVGLLLALGAASSPALACSLTFPVLFRRWLRWLSRRLPISPAVFVCSEEDGGEEVANSDSPAGRALRLGLALARNLRLVCRGLQAIHFLTFALLKLARGGEMFRWHRLALGYPPGEAEYEAREPWFVDVYCLEMMADIGIAGMLDLSFANVLVLVAASFARFCAVVAPLMSSDAHIVAVGMVHAVVLGAYLWVARKRLQQASSARRLRNTAEMVGLWATT